VLLYIQIMKLGCMPQCRVTAAYYSVISVLEITLTTNLSWDWEWACPELVYFH